LDLNIHEEDNHFVLDITNEEPVIYSFDINETEEENALAFDEGNKVSAFDEGNNEDVNDSDLNVDAFDTEEAAEYANLTVEAAASMEALNLAPTMHVEVPEEASNVHFVTPEAEEPTEALFVLDMNEAPAVDYGNSFVLNKPTNIYSDVCRRSGYKRSGGNYH